MEILRQLGIDGTLWIQLAFFGVCYFFISQFIFKPYMTNLAHRKKNTTGASDEAVKLMAATDHLAMDYAGKMKDQNEQVLEVFNQIKNEGKSEEQKLITTARNRAEKLIAEANDKIAKEIQGVKTQLEKTIPELSRATAKKLLGRDV